MPKSRQTSVMASPSRSRATKRRRSSITELAFHGIHTSRRTKAESVTHVSGTFCHLCLGPLTKYERPDRLILLCRNPEFCAHSLCFGPIFLRKDLFVLQISPVDSVWNLTNQPKYLLALDGEGISRNLALPFAQDRVRSRNVHGEDGV